jgi:hypothetical protein
MPKYDKPLYKWNDSYVISSLRSEIDENCARLGYYAAQSSSSWILDPLRWDRQVFPKRR